MCCVADADAQEGEELLGLKSMDEAQRAEQVTRWAEARLRARRERSWPAFSAVAAVSALTGEGVEELRAQLLSFARPLDNAAGRCALPGALATDEEPRRLVAGAVWTQLLERLSLNVPYDLRHIDVDRLERDASGTLQVAATVHSPNEHISKIANGRAGVNINAVRDGAQKQLEQLFAMPVCLRLNIRTHKRSRKRLS